METSVSSSPSWQRSVYQAQFDQTFQPPQYGGYDSRDPNWRQEYLSEDTVREDDFVNQSVGHSNSLPSAHPLARHYPQYEEGQTEFRGEASGGLNLQQQEEGRGSLENDPASDPAPAGRREGTFFLPRYSEHYSHHTAYTGDEGSDYLNSRSSRSDGHSRSAVGGAVTSNTKYTGKSGYKQGEEDYDSEEEDVNQRFYHQDFAEHSWRKVHEGSGTGSPDWKRPDMHMFKASSYKGSVTSERSSRLDPHTYQSYAAGLLYSSGRSEKFLKLQKHFAVLERIGELDKPSMQKDLKWQDLGASAQSFQSEEELQELYTELKEAKKKKEFFHDTDKKDQVMWHPEKDFGLKNKVRTLEDQVTTYRSLIEDKSAAKSSPASKVDRMKRAVSFGELYDRFHKSETAEPGQESVTDSPRCREIDNVVKATVPRSSNPPPSEETEPHGRASVKQSVTSPTPVSYLQLMESAARKSRLRAVHGTHMDSPCNDYEAYVKQVSKVNKEDSDFNKMNFQPPSHRPHYHQTNPEPDKPGSKEKPHGSGEHSLRDHRNVKSEKTYQSKETLQASKNSRNLQEEKPVHEKQTQQSPRHSRNMYDEKPRHSEEYLQTSRNSNNLHDASSEIVIDSFTTPKPGLTVRSEEKSDRLGPHSLSVRGPAFKSDTSQGHGYSHEDQTSQGDYVDLDSTDTSQSENSQEKVTFSDMPDIIQMEKHRKPLKTSTTDPSLFRPTLPASMMSDSRKRPHSTYEARTDFSREHTINSYSQPQQNQTFSQKEDSRSQQAESPQNLVEPNRLSASEKGAVFQVRNLRNLAENNEFSNSQLSWMKKPANSATDREIGISRNQVQHVAAPEPQGAAREFRGVAKSQTFPVAKVDTDKSSGASVVSRDPHPWAQPAISAHGKFTPPVESSHRSVYTEKKAPLPYKKPETLNFQPMPSQSGPVFSASRRGTESRTKEMETTRYPNSGAEIRQTHSKYSPYVPERSMEPVVFDSNKGMKQTETVLTHTPKKEYTTASETGQQWERESDPRDAGRGRRPGDGSDSQSSDKQYGQLRKWTAVADIYRDVEKSWSPTRETPSFPPENNSSISSTDTFIVKDTDGEQDDLESSLSSVSRLRQIFERQQTVSKSKSEPDMSSDSNEEPRRPRSAKSQADLSSLHGEEASPAPGMARTVSGDLRDLRNQYQYRPDHDNRQLSDFEPDSHTEYNRPTDVALRAWVHYTDRPRYDPYLPPEDILKEVSSASTGRKLDIPRPKNYRPSNVSRMTLEYLNQIGSEWQQSGNRSYVPQNSQVQGSLPAQPSLQHVDRRYVSHQYVNEDNPFATDYPQTDDLKLKQSQWAGASGFGKESEQHFNQKSSRNSDQRQEYSASSQQQDPVVSQPWTPSGVHKAQPVKTLFKQSETAPSQTTGRQAPVPFSASTVKQPAGSVPKVKAAPVPAQRSKLQPWRPQVPQIVKSETNSLHSSLTTSSANLHSQNSVNNSAISSGHFAQNTRRNQKGDLEDRSQLQETARPIPPEPARMPPLSPRLQHKNQPRALQHSRSKSTDSERSSGDFGGVYCVSTGSVLYGVEAEEEEPTPPLPTPSQSQSSQPSSSATFPRKHAARQQPDPRGSGNPLGFDPRTPAAASSSASFGPSGQAPSPPARGGRSGGGGGGALRGAGTLPLPRTKTFPRGSSLSAAEQLGVRSPPPSSSSSVGSAGLGGVSGRSWGSAAKPGPAAVFKHQTTDEQRRRTEPVNPEKERRRKEEEEAYRKKRLEELYEEERLKKMRRDEADAEARRHHDFYTNAQKSPISPNRFDDAPSSLSPSAPGSLGTLERKGPPLSVPPERRRGFQIQGKARALFNFTAQNPRELSFRKNDILYLLRQVDKHWFEGERHGMLGIFPTNYVEVVTSIEAAQAAAMQAEGQGRAKYNFTAQSSVELSLRKGEFVVLLRRVDENWYEGRIGNRQGIFPVSYVEITREPSTPLVTPAPSVITTPMTGTPEMLSPVGYDAAPTPPPQPSPSALSYQRSPYNYPQAPPHAGYGPGSGSLLTPATSRGLSPQEQGFGGPRSPITNPKSPVSPGKHMMGSPGRRVSPGPPHGSGPSSRLQVDIQTSSKPFANGPPASSSASKVSDDDLALTRYRALYAYRPLNEDELELREGDEVFVMEKCDDGWFVGTSARSGCFGTFPGNYVQKICK